jgi:hypothetical protein
MNTIKVLVFAANPRMDLQLDEEIRKIEQKVWASQSRSLEMIPALAARGEDLIDRLNRHKPHIVHFSGHGSRAGQIFFVGDDGKAKPVNGRALSAVFRACTDNLRGVCFNACYASALAETLIADGVIDFAIGMNDSIGDEAARIFSARFYGSLGDGRSVQNAFDQAVAEMMVQGTNEERLPELHVRVGADVGSLTLELPKDTAEMPVIPSGELIIDSVGFRSHHMGTCVDRERRTNWWESPESSWAPSVSLGLTNLASSGILLVPRIEVVKRAAFPCQFCTFPNDPETELLIKYFERVVDLEDERSLSNILPVPLQLQPSETFSLVLAFRGRKGVCYRVQARAYWKASGKDGGSTSLSDIYLINFSTQNVTWEDRVAEAVAQGQPVYARLAEGVRAFHRLLRRLSPRPESIHLCELDYRSPMEEFLVLGDRSIIIAELPPKDRYIESGSVSRRGVLVEDPEIASLYRAAFNESTDVDWSPIGRYADVRPAERATTPGQKPWWRLW